MRYECVRVGVAHIVCVVECCPASMTAIFIRTAVTASKSLPRSGLAVDSFIEKGDKDGHWTLWPFAYMRLYPKFTQPHGLGGIAG